MDSGTVWTNKNIRGYRLMAGMRMRLNKRERQYLLRLIKGNIYKQGDMVSKDIKKLIVKLTEENDT